MAHFAKIENNIVTNVIVAEQEFIDTQDGTWVQTSYNTIGNIHYGSDGEPDGGVALRGNYAAIGYTYDATNDVFYQSKPYESWTLNTTTGLWEAPVDKPDTDCTHSDGTTIKDSYAWNEDNREWDKNTVTY